MIFRIAAAIIFTAVGGLIGCSLAEKLREKRRICAAIEHLFQRVKILLNRKSEDVFAICRELKSDSSLKSLKFIRRLPERFSAGENFRGSWRMSLEDDESTGQEERELLFRLGEILGSSDSASQIEAISGLQEELRKIDDIHRENLIKKGRLYRAAGLLFGVMAGILIL